MTKLEKAAKLEAEAKALRREEKAFKNAVMKRADEVKEWLNVSDKNASWEEQICSRYNVKSPEEKQALLAHLLSETQVNYYSRKF